MNKLLIFIFLISTVNLYAQKKELFNGKDLSNFEIVIKNKPQNANVDVDTIFFVKDGVINAKGKPFGYFRTKEKYENYKLHVEWRWVAKPKNSGVLLHVTGEDKVWPQNIEAQLRHNDAGDIVLVQEGSKATIRETTHQIKPGDKWWNIRTKFEESSEKPLGEWNEYDITCKDATVELKVNGVLQHYATDVYPNKGYIAFQGEGAWIQFRNITVEPLK
ncbi:MAG: DUF1080 domain-containing protein [Bacteroidales bacterium]|nr:DUF1080 domain-containing protein [Bacteroidales bacterium]